MIDRLSPSPDSPLPRRVLLVDEDPDLALRLETLLLENGYEVSVARNAEQALSLVKEGHPEVALLDIHPEEPEGFELLGNLRAIHPDLYCVLITSRAEVHTAVRALEERVFHYLAKPIDEALLLVTLERCFTVAHVEHEVRETREALQKRESLYKKAITYAHAVAYQRDYFTKNFSFIDEGIFDLTGYHPEELTQEVWGGLILERVMEGEGTGLPVEEAIRRTWAGELKVWSADYRIRTKDGQERWLFDSSVQLEDEAGKPIGALGILQDITWRKKAEEELRKLNAELEERVAQRTEQLRKINREMEQTNYILRNTVVQLRDRERLMADELTLAQEVQLQFLPKSFPFHDDLRFAAYYRSCSKIGGDLYDAFPLGPRMAGFYIADASGHGVSAALVTAVLKISFERLRKSLILSNCGAAGCQLTCSGNKTVLSDLLNDLSHALLDTIPERSFVTFQFGILCLESGRLLLANAGHNPPVHVRSQTEDESVREIEVPNNLPLGLCAEWPYQITETTLRPSDKLVLYTDGITEAQNANFDEFGLPTFLEGIARHGELDADGLVEKICAEVAAFVGPDQEANDDQSLLVIDFGTRDE